MCKNKKSFSGLLYIQGKEAPIFLKKDRKSFVFLNGSAKAHILYLRSLGSKGVAVQPLPLQM